ncbi:MAG: hypothetical protein QOH23_169, partial [Gaiellaceae bacterium]|nr:hypothetical protein [Gaiellaceae bacterium]
MAIVRVGVTEGDPAELTERYRRIQQRLRGDGGEFPPAGLKVHTAMTTPTGIRVANVWDSADEADAFRPRLEKAMTEEGG